MNVASLDHLIDLWGAARTRKALRYVEQLKARRAELVAKREGRANG